MFKILDFFLKDTHINKTQINKKKNTNSIKITKKRCFFFAVFFYFFLVAFAADLVTLAAEASFFETDLMTPTATV